jgi:hypothetical protein
VVMGAHRSQVPDPFLSPLKERNYVVNFDVQIPVGFFEGVLATLEEATATVEFLRLAYPAAVAGERLDEILALLGMGA